MAEQSSFCVFRYVTIPERSLITKAHIFFTSYDTRLGVGIDAEIYFADEDNSQPPTNKTDLDGRALTASVSWPSIEDWYDNKIYKTPDLKDILQEVMDRGGWASNNNVMAILKVTDGPDSGRFWSALEYLNEIEKACLRVWWKPAEQIQTPYISPEEEFQIGYFTCAMTTYPTDADIYYTDDGSDPDEGDTLYSAPFAILEDTVIKARAYKQYWLTSEIATQNYIAYYPHFTSFGFATNQTFWRFGTNKIVYGDEDQYYSWTLYNGFAAFRSINIPQGATITSAYLRFYVQSTSTADKDPDLYMKFHNVDDADPPTSAVEFITWLGEATTGTLWKPNTQWTLGSWYNSIDFTSELQAIINRPGWSSGNTALLFIECMQYTFETTQLLSNIRVAHQRISAHDNFIPELHVDWSGGGPDTYYPGDYEDDGEVLFNQQAVPEEP